LFSEVDLTKVIIYNINRQNKPIDFFVTPVRQPAESEKNQFTPPWGQLLYIHIFLICFFCTHPLTHSRPPKEAIKFKVAEYQSNMLIRSIYMVLYISRLSPNPPPKRGRLSPEVEGALIQDKCVHFGMG
jgi:hypothetical protein